MNRAEKQAEIEFLSEGFQRAQIALCADYRGLNVAQITTLRSNLRKTGATGRVVKNTLARISAERVLKDANASDADKFLKLFEGPSLLVFSDDPVAPAKVFQDFLKDKKNDKLQVKGGWLDGAFVDPAGVEALSKMPSREDLLAQLLSVINAPATQVVRLLQAPGQQIVQVLEAHRRNLEEKGAA